MIGLLTPHSVFCQMDVSLYVSVPAFSLKFCYVLMLEIGGTDFPDYSSLFPCSHDSIQETFINIPTIDSMCEKGFIILPLLFECRWTVLVG